MMSHATDFESFMGTVTSDVFLKFLFRWRNESSMSALQPVVHNAVHEAEVWSIWWWLILFLPLSCPDADALKNFQERLTEFEQEEIMDYSEIWFMGLGSQKIEASHGAPQNNGFDDEHGSYIRVISELDGVLGLRSSLVNLYTSRTQQTCPSQHHLHLK